MPINYKTIERKKHINKDIILIQENNFF